MIYRSGEAPRLHGSEARSWGLQTPWVARLRTPALLSAGTSDGNLWERSEQLPKPPHTREGANPGSIWRWWHWETALCVLRAQSYINLFKRNRTPCLTPSLIDPRISQRNHAVHQHQLGLHIFPLLPRRTQSQKASEIHRGLWDVLSFGGAAGTERGDKMEQGCDRCRTRLATRAGSGTEL